MNKSNYVTRRQSMILIGGVSLPALAGCTNNNNESSMADDLGGEMIFDQRSSERESERFDATRGDEIVVDVFNRDGFRTHVNIRSRDSFDGIGNLLSEGVQDEARFRVQVEEDAEYVIEMTPHDETWSTEGEMRAVLVPGEGSN